MLIYVTVKLAGESGKSNLQTPLPVKVVHLALKRKRKKDSQRKTVCLTPLILLEMDSEICVQGVESETTNQC